jgi:hypothetical protein
MSGRTGQQRTGGHLASDTTPVASLFKAGDCPAEADTLGNARADTCVVSQTAVRLLSFIRERGGVLVGGQRGMAEAMGCSKTRLNEVLHELARAGLVLLDTRPTGTVVRLIGADICEQRRPQFRGANALGDHRGRDRIGRVSWRARGQVGIAEIPDIGR